MTIEIHPVTPAIGAEIRGVDLSKPLSNETVDTLRAALHAYLVLLFRNQKLTESDHIAFAGRFGPIQVPPLKTKYHDNPEINVLDQASPRGDGADNWHADHTYTKQPALGSIVRAVKISRYGGDTMFASMYAAYDALSTPMKQMLEGLTAEHDITRSARRGIRAGHVTESLAEIQRRLPPVHHPVIPPTGPPRELAQRRFSVPKAETQVIFPIPRGSDERHDESSADSLCPAGSPVIAPILSLVTGAATWTLVEYLLHRFVFHGSSPKAIGAVEHRQHHARPDYFAPWWQKALAALAVTAVMLPGVAFVAGAETSLCFTLGFIAMYLLYELLHRRAHTQPPRGPYGRWRRRNHFAHHFADPRRAHGVTSPMWDRVFRTRLPLEPVRVPRRLAMPWLVAEDGRVREAFASDYVLVGGARADEQTRRADSEAALENRSPAAD